MLVHFHIQLILQICKSLKCIISKCIRIYYNKMSHIYLYILIKYNIFIIYHSLNLYV